MIRTLTTNNNVLFLYEIILPYIDPQLYISGRVFTLLLYKLHLLTCQKWIPWEVSVHCATDKAIHCCDQFGKWLVSLALGAIVAKTVSQM